MSLAKIDCSLNDSTKHLLPYRQYEVFGSTGYLKITRYRLNAKTKQKQQTNKQKTQRNIYTLDY